VTKKTRDPSVAFHRAARPPCATRALAIAAAFSVLVGCGARSGLLDPGVETVSTGPDASAPSGCEAGPSVPIFVIARHEEDDSSVLYRFDPPSQAFTRIGQVDCPVTPGMFDPNPQVFSMAVSRTGTAFVLFDNGQMFTVDTSSAGCTATGFVSGASSLTQTFGMGFSANPGGTTETLYLASFSDPSPSKLARLDTSTFAVDLVGSFSRNEGDTELTGTADGRLYGLAVSSVTSAASVVAIDPTDAVIASAHVLDIPFPTAYSFAYWRDDLYVFLGAGGSATGTQVARYHIADQSFEMGYATLADDVVFGAGVSTCAPL
jgi:hypothetical protein